MPYHYVWNYIRKIEGVLGSPVMQTYRGGRAGGGGARLTKLGKNLLKEYKRAESLLNKALVQ